MSSSDGRALTAAQAEARQQRRAPAGAAVLRVEVTEAIRQALRQELAAVGYGRLSIEAVARRAGVGKTAIYRRWASKLELVLELVAEMAGQKLPFPDTGSLRGDLEVVLRVLAGALRHPLASQIVPDLLAEAARNPKMASTLHEALRANQRGVTATLLERAAGRDELPADTDIDAAVDLIVGPLYWRLAVARTPLPADHMPRLAAAVEAALRVTRAQGSAGSGHGTGGEVTGSDGTLQRAP